MPGPTIEEAEGVCLPQVVPAEGHAVKLRALGEGRSRLRVRHGALTKALIVEAAHGDQGPRIDISH
jgi:hypothetical protein